MKKKILVGSLFLVLFALLVGCGSKSEEKKLTIGATPVPHAELLNLIKDDLAKEGITLEVKEFTDYVQPNIAVSNGDLDANFFQHLPYLENFCKEQNIELASIATIHVEPLGLFSKKYTSLDQLPDGARIAVPNDPTNEGRALLLLQAHDLITLSETAGLEGTVNDITSNPRNFEFSELEAAQLPRILDDFDGAIINGNYALEADLSPAEDALLVEGAESPYANIIAVKKGDEKREDLAKLVEVLQSEKVEKYILDNYKGGVLPAFSK
jgi:D-methionine transport system substrate-binding protein